MYQYKGPRKPQCFSYEIPAYLAGGSELVKITKDGVSKIGSFTLSGTALTFEDKVVVTAFYVFGKAGTYDELSASYDAVLTGEAFDIYANEAYYGQLQSEYGYSDEDPHIPDPFRKMDEPGTKILYFFLGALIRPLGKIISAIVAVLYLPVGLVKKVF